MHAQCENMMGCSVHHSKYHDYMAHALDLIVAGNVIRCSIMLQIGICVREK